MEPVYSNEGKMVSAEKGLFYLRDVYTNLMIITKHKSRAEILNSKKKKKKGNWEKCHRKPPNQTGKHKYKEKETTAISNNQKTKDEMATISLHLSIIILNVNGSAIKRHRVAGWIKK